MDTIARAPPDRRRSAPLPLPARILIQETLAKRACLRQATISTIESGNPEAQVRTLAAILAALAPEHVVRPLSQQPRRTS